MANTPSSTFAYGSTGQARNNNTQMSVDSEKRKSKLQRRKMAEYDAKSEYEGSKDHLRVLMDQYGTKSKVVEDINRESTELQSKIMDLMRKAQMRGKPFNLTPPQTVPQNAGPCLAPPTPQTPSTMDPAPSKQSEFSLTRAFFALLWLPFQIAFSILRTVYRNLNWGTVLLTVAMMELTIVGIIWGIRRSHHNYLYVEPYEAEIHGTFGVESSSSFDIVMSVISIIRDFFAEVINGGRGFGSPEYVGYVPI